MNFDPYAARAVPDSVRKTHIIKDRDHLMYERCDAVQWEVVYLFVVTDLAPTTAIYEFEDGKLLFFAPIKLYEYDILNAFGVPHLSGDDIQRTFHLYRPQMQLREDDTSMNWTGAMTFSALPEKQIKGAS